MWLMDGWMVIKEKRPEHVVNGWMDGKNSRMRWNTDMPTSKIFQSGAISFGQEITSI